MSPAGPTSLRPRLLAFVTEQLAATGRVSDAVLTDETPLLSTTLLDSLALVELAALIEREIGRPVDLTEVDIVTEWETVRDIGAFIDRCRGAGGG